MGVNPWWVTVLAMAALLALLGFCILTRFPLSPLVFSLLAGLFVLLATLAYYRATKSGKPTRMAHLCLCWGIGHVPG